MLLVLWVLTIFGMRISGAHYNPCISIAYMLRKDVGSFPRILGLAYIVMQILGAFLGAMIAWFLVGGATGLIDDTPVYSNSTVSLTYKNSDSGCVYPACTWEDSGTKFNETHNVFECSYSGFAFGAIIAETIGSFFVAFFYLS